jgi:putative PIN family toxin of toxin-antitoxin system
VVPDTNVLVSALLQPLSAPGAVLLAWRRSEIEFVVCPALLDELTAVLGRPKLRGRIHEQEADALVSLLRSQAELRADPHVEPGLTRDPKDDFIVALARTTGAALIVSGDDDLAGVEDVSPPALRPAQLLELLRELSEMAEGPSLAEMIARARAR